MSIPAIVSYPADGGKIFRRFFSQCFPAGDISKNFYGFPDKNLSAPMESLRKKVYTNMELPKEGELS